MPPPKETKETIDESALSLPGFHGEQKQESMCCTVWLEAALTPCASRWCETGCTPHTLSVLLRQKCQVLTLFPVISVGWFPSSYFFAPLLLFSFYPFPSSVACIASTRFLFMGTCTRKRPPNHAPTLAHHQDSFLCGLNQWMLRCGQLRRTPEMSLLCCAPPLFNFAWCSFPVLSRAVHSASTLLIF